MIHELAGWINSIFVIAAYLMGSIPTAVWWGRRFHGVDVRDHGSKNAGATNTFRVLGKKAAIPVLLIDIIKGFVPVMVLPLLSPYDPGTIAYTNLQIASGLAAVIGHIFPAFADFRGGKGVATLLGVILALHPLAAMGSVGLFLLVFLATRYVSLGSLIAAVAYPILVILIFQTPFVSLMFFSVVFAMIVFITHIRNIERLLKKEENRITFNKKDNR